MALLRLAAEATRDLILIGRPGAPEWVSPSVTELLGHTPEAFIRERPSSFVHPDDLDEVHRARLASSGEEIGGRFRVRHADGTYRWMDARARLIPDDDGGLTDRSVSSWRCVDDEVQVLAELRASEQRYRLLVENVNDGVALERDGTLVWASPNLHSMLGWDPNRWRGRDVLELVERSPEVQIERTWESVDGRFTLRLRVGPPDQAPHWVEVHTRPYVDDEGRRDGTVCTFRIVDAEVAVERELERRARYDQLTGLMNRKEIIDRLDLLGADGRRAGTESAVLFCDLDGFKAVNDGHGHAVGDMVLKELAARVRDSVREGDLVARIGGDEILVVLHHLHGIHEALAVAEQIRQAAARPMGGPTGSFVVTMSIGVTMVRPGDTADDVIVRADQAMYRAKESGRDGVQRLPLEPWGPLPSADPEPGPDGLAEADTR